MEVINLNLIPNGTNPVVHVSQYDEGRDFRFNLFDGTSVLTLDGTETIECDVKKPDGNIVTVAVSNTSDSYIVVTTTLQMTACGGNSLGTINISKGGINLYTLNFVLYCERSPLENGIESESSIHNLNTMVDEMVAEEVATQYDSSNVIFDTQPEATHGIGYTVTSEGIKTAIDNAFDYDNTASGSLVHITDGADNIPVKSLVSEIVAVESGSGTKSPTNPYTISGFDNAVITRCGVNLIKKQALMQPVHLASGTTIYAKLFNSSRGFNLYGVKRGLPDITSNWTALLTLSSDLRSVTLTDDYEYIGISNSAYTDLGSGDIQVSLAPFSDFSAYNGNTYTFDWGANIWDEVWELGTLNTTTGDNSSATTRIRSKNYIPVKPNTTYTYRQGTASGQTTGRACYYDVNKTFISSSSYFPSETETFNGVATFTTPNNACYMRFSPASGYGTTYNNDISISYPTVYGGHFDNKGNLVVTHGYHELTGTEDWAWGKSTTYSGGFYTPVTSVGAKVFTPFICTHAKTALNISEYEWGTCFCDGSLNIRIMQASDTVQDWKDYLASQYANGTPVTICYELANPITLAITSQDIPTLLGENNIFSNCGDVEVTYYTSKSNDILEFVDSEIGKKNGTNIPIEENSQDSIKDYIDDEISSTKNYIDNGLSGKADSNSVYAKAESFYCPQSHDFESGTTSSDAIIWFINTYGTKPMSFGFVITGLGWFECFLTFYSASQGGGILLLNGSSRLWAVTYINGVITLTEK